MSLKSRFGIKQRQIITMIIVTLIKQTNNYFDEKQSTESGEVNNQIWILTISSLWNGFDFRYVN